MKLTELNNNRRSYSTRVLKEQYEMPFNVDNMSMSSTRTMLTKVRGLMNESKQTSDYHNSQSSSSYMKLVFMEQALSDHYNELRSQPQARIMVENEEVEKSQVVLAAQDMVDSVQKMYEDVNDMLVKELPALTDSVQSEIGVTESTSFNQTASAALTGLNAALQQAKIGLQSALGGLTGQGATDAFAPAPDAGAEETLDMDMGADQDTGGGGDEELPPAPDFDTDEEEPEMPLSGAGRAKR